jgi:hypothetical protein
MPKAFVRVRQLSQTPVGNFVGGKFNMAIKLTPGSIPLIANFADSNPPVCNHVYRFDMQTADKAVFEVTLMESNVFSKTDIARVTLPLNWFPKDRVLTHWFPLKPIKHGTGDLLVLFDIHISYDGSPEFQAAPGNLLVKPCWIVPRGLPIVSSLGSVGGTISYEKVQPQNYQINQGFGGPQQMMTSHAQLMGNSYLSDNQKMAMMGGYQSPMMGNSMTGGYFMGSSLMGSNREEQKKQQAQNLPWSSQPFFKK